MSWEPQSFTRDQRRGAGKTIGRVQSLIHHLDPHEFGPDSADLIPQAYSRVDDLLDMVYQDIYGIDGTNPQPPTVDELVREWGEQDFEVASTRGQRLDSITPIGVAAAGGLPGEPPAQPAGPLNLDDLTALTQLIEGVAGHALTPDESSKLKAAYQTAQKQHSRATLPAIATMLQNGAE